jgi:hypothetical protein
MIMEYYDKKEYNKAKQLADQGDALAQFTLGLMYYNALGVDQNWLSATKNLHFANAPFPRFSAVAYRLSCPETRRAYPIVAVVFLSACFKSQSQSRPSIKFIIAI